MERRDVVIEEVNAEAENDEVPAENVEGNEGENVENEEADLRWETEKEEEDVPENVHAEPEAPVQGEAEMKVKDVEVKSLGSREKFYDAVEEEGIIDEDDEALAVVDKVVEVPAAPDVDTPAPTVPEAPVAQVSTQ
ncbi:hypothetical protein Dimus_003551 [Dionaea muscipula]